MDWVLPETPGVLYEAIVELIERAIDGALLAPGERLPAERKLAEALGVNRSTVRQALDDLTDRGLLVRKQGSGTYVNAEKWGLLSRATFRWKRPEPSRREPIPITRGTTQTPHGDTALLDLRADSLPEDLLPDMLVPETSWRELVRAESSAVTSHLGLPELVDAYRNFFRSRLGVNVESREILVTSGTQQALFLVVQGLLAPGDAVGVEAPSYFYSLPMFQATGIRLFALPMDGQGITLEGLEEVHRKHALKMLIINPVFQNPTGRRMHARRKRDIVRFCAAKHIPIMEDDAYSQLTFHETCDVTPLKRYDTDGSILYAGTLSSYAGRNLRAGWLAAPAPVIARLAEIRRHMDAGLSVLPQLMALEYLRTIFPAHKRTIAHILAQRAERLIELLRERCGDAEITYAKPEGGLYLYARWSHLGVKETSIHAWLRECGFLGVPGRTFGDCIDSCRLNYACLREA